MPTKLLPLLFGATCFVGGCAGADEEAPIGETARTEAPAVQYELVENLRNVGAGVELDAEGHVRLVTHREGGFHNEHLRLLTGLEKIEVLRVLGGEARMSDIEAPPNVTDEGITYLAGLTSLKRLNLTETGLTDAGVTSLTTLANLEELILVGTEVTDASLDGLSHLTKLSRLELAGTQITDEALKWMPSFPNLSWLDVHSTDITDAGLLHLAECTSLTTLDIVDCPGISDAGVAKLTQALPNCDVIR